MIRTAVSSLLVLAAAKQQSIFLCWGSQWFLQRPSPLSPQHQQCPWWSQSFPRHFLKMDDPAGCFWSCSAYSLQQVDILKWIGVLLGPFTKWIHRLYNLPTVIPRFWATLQPFQHSNPQHPHKITTFQVHLPILDRQGSSLPPSSRATWIVAPVFWRTFFVSPPLPINKPTGAGEGFFVKLQIEAPKKELFF